MKQVWSYIGLFDNGSVIGACEFCSTAIRYEHIIEPPQGARKNVGVCCAEEATERSPLTGDREC